MSNLIDRDEVEKIFNASFNEFSDTDTAIDPIIRQYNLSLKKEILSLHLQQQWIPVSERLPENWQSIFVYLLPMEEWVEWDIKDARFFSDTLWTRFRVWAWDFVHWMYVKYKEYIQRDTDDILYKLTHWQPLPLPPNN